MAVLVAAEAKGEVAALRADFELQNIHRTHESLCGVE